MSKLTPGQMQALAWTVSGGAAIIAVIAWAQTYGWRLSGMGVYQIFPVFGLLAFSLMWSHYIASALRQHFGQDKGVLKEYFEITSAVVLTAIILHPALLEWQLWRDGLGLPPGSLKGYVGAASYWAVWLGLTAWVIFIFYEFRRVFGRKKWWPLVQYASDAAMFLIFVHALKLGGVMDVIWFRGVWWFYGFSLLFAILYGYRQKLNQSKTVRK